MLYQFTIQKAIEMALEYLPKLTLALLTLVAGLWLIRLPLRFVGKVIEARKKEFDKTEFPYLIRKRMLI